MSLSAKIREQLINSFRAELAEHVQTMNDGLLALEQNRMAAEQRRSTLEDVFRAAHSLKGAARAIGVTAVEQVAHALEDVLAAMQTDAIALTPDLYTACYRAIDAIQTVQEAYESGETTPPTEALQALADLEPFRAGLKTRRAVHSSEATSPAAGAAPAAEAPKEKPVSTVVASESAHVTDSDGSPDREPTASQTQDDLVPVPPSPGSGNTTVLDETIRVSVSKLDALMAQLSELLVTKIRAEQRITQMRHIQGFVAEWQREWFAVRNVYSRMARKQRHAGNGGAEPPRPDRDWARLMAYLEASQDNLRELNALVAGLSREYDQDAMHTSLVIDELEQEIKRVRMLPLSMITASFGRMIRDLARADGKEAVLEIAGGDVELDKRVLEQIKDPLMHLLRNAIDHGIEPPDVRIAAGKPRTGTVTLRAEQLGKDVIVWISDDGAGLDIPAIRQVAGRRRGGDDEVDTLSESELAELIFYTGFSTSPIITDVSGRGVGLDVVRRNIELLGGRIDVTWEVGQGTTFKLTLPLTLTSSRGLLVRVSDQIFAIPLSAIERILYLKPDQILPLGGHDTVRHDGRPITLVRLSDVLELAPKPEDDDHVSVVVLAAAERRMAFAVDEFVGEQEVVIKGLGRQLSRVGGIAGATVMGSGEVVLILNVADLMKLAAKNERHPALQALPEGRRAPESTAPRILIVDDSLTTRTLEKNILEAAGYEIEIATDGQEALGSIAANGVPDLIISDISMPRLDGFGLTQRIKSDPRTTDVPVILVTSLDSVEDKSRGIEVGADAYIVKSRFDQNNLLETIKQLI